MRHERVWLLLALALLGAGLIYLLGPVLTPFLSAALLAYLGNPLVNRLAGRISRTLAVSLVFVLLFGALILAILILIPVLESQIRSFVQRLPGYLDWGQRHLLPLVAGLVDSEPGGGLDIQRLREALAAHWQQAGGLAAGLFKALSSSGLMIFGVLANLVLIPVVTFYLLRDWNRLVAGIHELLPRPLEPRIAHLAREADSTLSAFLRGQLLVMLALGTVYAIGLYWVGLDLALLFGMIAGLVSFVPYLGVIVGVLLAGGAALVQFQELLPLIGVLAVFGVGQLLESFLLTPYLVGDRIGLHPVAVIFAVMAGGALFGFVGVLLALPVAAVVMVGVRELRAHYLGSDLYREA